MTDHEQLAVAIERADLLLYEAKSRLSTSLL